MHQRSIRSVHFTGICGTAMGNAAAMMAEAGFDVGGSDQGVYPPMSTFLEERGIRLMDGFREGNLGAGPDLCVIGNAVGRGNPEVEAILNRRLYYLSLPEALRELFLRGKRNLVVSGTHGKTTTTSMLAWILEASGHAPSFLVGGIPENFGRGCRSVPGPFWVLEGDEYDSAFFDKRPKFLHYLPEVAVINNVEFDHADIYADLEAIQLQFRRLAGLVPTGGAIFVNADDPAALAVTAQAPAPVTTVGFSEAAGIPIRDAQHGPEGTRFRLFDHPFELPMSGAHNARNAAMAAAAAHFCGVSPDAAADALRAFKGVKRRQEVRAEVGGVTVVDDFGHHPTAIAETIAALRHRYPGRRIWALFEPRSNTTRRAVFQHRLPEALAAADGAFVAQVARLDQLPPDQRLDPERVVADIAAAGRPAFYEPDANAIVARLAPLCRPGDVIAVFSNGGFGGIHAKIADALQARA